MTGQRVASVDPSRLCAKTFVRHAEWFATLGSTNDRAAQLAARADLATPTLVVAGLQTAGRGRGSRIWWSEAGALTFSLVLEPAALPIATPYWPQVSLAAAVAVCDTLRSEAPNAPVGIKWPNDVLIDGGKVCGILVESPGGAAPSKDRLIIGVGINVNNSWHTAPHEAGPSGTALCDVTGQTHSLESVLLELLRAAETRLTQLAAGDDRLPEAWQRLDLLAQRRTRVDTNGTCIDGTCVGIARDGALMIDSASGRQHVYSGSVTVDG